MSRPARRYTVRSWGDWGPFGEGEVPSKTGTVVVLGWGGAHVDELRNVADAYLEELGKGWRAVATTLSAHPPPGDDDKRLASRVDMLLKAQFSTVAEACASADDVIVVAFSNNGAFTLKHLLKRFPAMAEKIRAVQFDSAAGLSVGGQMPDVVKGAILGDLSRRGGVFASLLATVATSEALAKNVDDFLALGEGAWTEMNSDIRELAETVLPKACPLLFVCSPGDQLIPASAVEAFADLVGEHRESGQARVFRCILDNSPHVKHFYRHREAYVGAVRDLLRSAELPAGDDQDAE